MVELPAIKDFSCGSQPWEMMLSEWIKGRTSGNSVIEDVTQRDAKVWIYLDDSDHIVGFGSLGETVWKYPGPRDKLPIFCIPMLAIRVSDHRKGYGRQILRDLRSKAEKLKMNHAAIGLFVDPSNSAAIAMYTAEGFTKIDRRGAMDRMMLRL